MPFVAIALMEIAVRVVCKQGQLIKYVLCVDKTGILDKNVEN